MGRPILPKSAGTAVAIPRPAAAAATASAGSRGRRGPAPSITLEVVRRVSERFGRGMPLKLALEAEAKPKINVDTWEKALAKHENFRGIYKAAKGKFLDEAMRRLQEAEDLKYVCWLLERRHTDLFARAVPVSQTNVNVNQQVAVGIPSDVLTRAREIAGSNK